MWRIPRILLASLGLILGPGSMAPAAPLGEPVLHIEGMTFVGSRGSVRELVVRARTARLRTDENVAELVDVDAQVSAGGDVSQGFTLTCARARFDLDTNDFRAEGNVQGVTSDGQHYAAPWVRYVHAEGLLYTDEPVRLEDDSGSFRGDGFRYHLTDRRFQLLGNVRVEQLQ